MPAAAPRTVVSQDLEGFQRQYGTLREATRFYLAGRMPEELAQAFERVVRPEFLLAVAQMEFVDAVRAALHIES